MTIQKRKSKRWLSFWLAGILLLSALPGVLPVTAASVPPAAETPVEKENSYYTYMNAHKGDTRPTASTRLSASDGLLDGSKVNGDEAIVQTGSTLQWTFTVPSTGVYRVAIQYRYTNLTGLNDAQYGLRINGEYPFAEASAFSLKRLWENENGIVADTFGNDRKPTQVQVEQTTYADIVDEKGVVSQYGLFLNAGENQLSMTWETGGAAIREVKIYNSELVTYEAYHASRAAESRVDFYEQLQAENNLYKNDSSIVPSSDRTGPATIPNHPTQLRMNILAGSSYKMPGQSVTWEVVVPETGLYAIGIRYQQADLQGLIVSRRLWVDDAVPFSKLDSIVFAYTSTWNYREFGDGGAPYEVYLTKGRHTLTLEVVPGDMGVLMQRLENVVYSLNSLYRQIIMITSTRPDAYRDYSLETEIPSLLPTFEQQISELRSITEAIEAITHQKGGQTSCLSQTAYQLQSFIEKPYTIAARLDAYKSNVTAISSLVNMLQQQPLSVDYITVRGLSRAPVKTEASFWKKSWFEVQKFVGSFFSDYVTVGSVGQTDVPETITAWCSGGRENAEILKQLFDTGFTAKHHIGVNLQLVQIPLSQAILAGREPDVVLNVSRSEIVNFAARGVMQPLDEFDGFTDITKRFLGNAFIPYTYQGRIYGVPVTLGYHMMFYRTDILAELGLSYPQTWDEFYDIIPIIQRANLFIGVPVATKAYSTSLGTDDIFATLLLQNGGQVYNADGSRVELDEAIAMETFRQWTDLYTQYKFDKEFDFYNRFRTGEMPIGIAGYQTYNMFKATTPEINGLWEMVPIPGKRRGDGTIDRTELGSGTAAIITKGSDKKAAAWEFVKWWTSAEAQAEYGRDTEVLLGAAARYSPACIEAISLLPWTAQEKDVLLRQLESVTEIPEVVGGYYTARGINNAFRNVVLNGQNYREALMEQTIKINQELIRKRKEFDLE